MILRDGNAILSEGEQETVLGRIAGFPCVMQDPAKFTLDSVLAAIGAAVALGITPDLVRAGRAHFDPDRQFSPPPAAPARSRMRRSLAVSRSLPANQEPQPAPSKEMGPSRPALPPAAIVSMEVPTFMTGTDGAMCPS